LLREKIEWEREKGGARAWGRGRGARGVRDRARPS
jgi:hypothetical protein